MALIKIDFQGLTACEAQLVSQINDLNNLNDRLESLLLRISDSWEGDASEAYITVMRERQNKAQLMVGVLNEFLEYVRRAKTEFKDQDRGGASRIRGSF